ncbi:MAG TPA: uroporphyrinogen-III synthase [Burkholderiales bacterium]|nr:uroporphyrinogen-III synthase [Burkholderiales bacterium]
MRVLVTRPANEARRWVDELRRRGLDAQALPLIEIAPVAGGAAIALAWGQLDRFRAAMFVSGNAVRHFFGQKPVGAHWPAQTRAWSPGAGTRDALRAAGVDATLVDAPPPEAAQFDSETLWQQVAGQVAAGDRVLIVRGGDAQGTSSGRDWLADQLVAAGAQVEFVVAYRRQPPRLSQEQLAQAKQATGTNDCVWLFSSSQAIAHLQGLLPGHDWALARAVATHPRIAKAARAAGFGVVCESRPSMDAVVAALESFR